ncbi:glycerol kinase 3-like isoform X1 [Oscarella lobularis]|uniref:glycerol kinase 3-like isoform X1 n=1 Tax=Oscarella lobularis TaxID=121494 RepID=UPI00331443F5
MSSSSLNDCGPFVGALDQGTTSTRFMVFSAKTGEAIKEATHQIPFSPSQPNPGWSQVDPTKLLQTSLDCIENSMRKCQELGIDTSQIKAIGITNQRETTVVWDKTTGKPLHDAIVWLDMRTTDTVDSLIKATALKTKDALQLICGLPINPYFSAVKLRWLLDNSDVVRSAVAKGNCMFGTVDSWLIWNLTGGIDGGEHVTDVTNASRTMLMSIKSHQWDKSLMKFFDIPGGVLFPKIKSSSEVYGHIATGPLEGVPIAGCLGDQSAALYGHTFAKTPKKGDAKNTYGTGCFLLYNTGSTPVFSQHGLLTTVAFQLGPNAPIQYALEGSVAIGGDAVRWLRDNLQIIRESSDVEELASQVTDTGDVYFVPAFSGLFAPYWQPDARGVLVGLTQYTNRCHIARATLEAVCFQTREILEAMNKDSKIPLTELLVDGGMTKNSLLLQLQADLLGIPIVRAPMSETTALGVAMAAARAVGLNPDAATCERQGDTFNPRVQVEVRDRRYSRWKMAVRRSMNWVDKSNGETKVDKLKGRYHKTAFVALFLCSSAAALLLVAIMKRR